MTNEICECFIHGRYDGVHCPKCPPPRSPLVGKIRYGMLYSFLIVNRRNGDAFQVWARDERDAQAEYMSSHGNYWSDDDYTIVKLKATMRADLP